MRFKRRGQCNCEPTLWHNHDPFGIADWQEICGHKAAGAGRCEESKWVALNNIPILNCGVELLAHFQLLTYMGFTKCEGVAGARDFRTRHAMGKSRSQSRDGKEGMEGGSC